MTRTFSPSEAALSVFELAKRQPQFVLRFCIIFALIAMGANALAGAFGVGEAFQNYMALTAGGKIPDQERIVATLAPAGQGMTIILLYYLIFGVFTSAMGLRKAVRDEDSGLFGLQLGPDEVRLFLGMLLVGLILMLINISVSVLGGALTMGNRGLLVLVIAASFVAMLAIGIRLSQFGVMSIANNSVSVMASWQETKGQVWRLIGAYVLWSVVAGVIGVIAQALGTLGASALGATIGSGMPATLKDFLTPGWLFYALIYGLAAGLGNLGSICIGAYAWHQMRGDLPVAAGRI